MNSVIESWVLPVDKKCVRASFSRAALSYDNFAALQQLVADTLLMRLQALNYFPTKSILDLGAGTGYCGGHLTRYAESVIELDIAAAMLSFSRQRATPNVFHLCGDAESIPLADSSVGLIFSNLAFQWCFDLDRLFAEIFRVLMPGGKLIFSSFGPRTLSELRSAWATVDDYSHVNRFYPISVISESMLDAGLVECHLESEINDLAYDNVMQLMLELKAIGAHNMTDDRSRGLTGKQMVSRMTAAYQELMTGADIIATFDVVYACAARPGLDR